MSPHDDVAGPHRVGRDDVPVLNRLFADAFTERYRRDGLTGVRVPPLNPDVWTYAIDAAGDGAMLWRDADGDLAAFNIAHCSGTEGWMGPLAVRPDLQGLGLGRRIVEQAIAYLTERAVTTLGLETMPRTVENIGFYSRIGFTPGHLTVTLGRDVPADPFPKGVHLLSAAGGEAAQLAAGCREVLQRHAPGYDFTREFDLTRTLGLGDTAVCPGDGGVEGFALWHSVPLAEGRRAEELRLLKVFAQTPAVFATLVRAAESTAAKLRIGRVAIRCQTRFTDAYRALVERGYQVRWTDLRMTLAGLEEPRLTDGVVLFSNWEI